MVPRRTRSRRTLPWSCSGRPLGASAESLVGLGSASGVLAGGCVVWARRRAERGVGACRHSRQSRTMLVLPLTHTARPSLRIPRSIVVRAFPSSCRWRFHRRHGVSIVVIDGISIVVYGIFIVVDGVSIVVDGVFVVVDGVFVVVDGAISLSSMAFPSSPMAFHRRPPPLRGATRPRRAARVAEPASPGTRARRTTRPPRYLPF